MKHGYHYVHSCNISYLSGNTPTHIHEYYILGEFNVLNYYVGLKSNEHYYSRSISHLEIIREYMKISFSQIKS